MRAIHAVALSLLFLLTSHADAQPIPVRDLLRPPAYANPTISRDGRWMAVTIPIKGRMNLTVLDLEKREAKPLTGYEDYDVVSVQWVGSDYLLFSVGQSDRPTGPGEADFGGLFSIHRDGGNVRTLAPTWRGARSTGSFVWHRYSYLRSIPGSEEEILATGYIRAADSRDIYRLNVKTGRATLLSLDRPERVFGWVLDQQDVARIAISSVGKSLTRIIHYRKDENSPWEELLRYNARQGSPFWPLSFEADNRTMLVASSQKRDTKAVYRYDPETKQLGELVARHARFDMGADAGGGGVPGVLIDPASRSIVGYSVEAERYGAVWTDPEYERVQRALDQALPATVNTFRRSPDGRRFLVWAYSDRHPARWYLFDEQARTLEELFASRPWIKPESLVPMRSFLLKTRDGLEIPSYYFLPNEYKSGTRLPTVVLIHGGPHVRAVTWGLQSLEARMAQLLASRGYAVIVPNFRITPGFGRRIYFDGFGTIGREMSADHEDAVKWGIEQGFADASRVCIAGASYGGYAVLMALARAPEMFRCGVAGLSVSDLALQLTSRAGDTYYSEFGVGFWLRIIGVKEVAEIPPSLSPVNLADRIKAPLLMYAGEADIRTPIEQTDNMIKALERAGNPPRQVIVKSREGHGFGVVEHTVELYESILKFFDDHIGGKRE